jgi:hypothetical protein
MYSYVYSPYSCVTFGYPRAVIMEDMMSTLSKLSFVELPVNVTRDVVGYKRKRLIGRIEEQRALLRDPGYTKTVKRWSGTKGAADRKEGRQGGSHVPVLEVAAKRRLRRHVANRGQARRVRT